MMTLENILNNSVKSIKEIGKSTIKFVKDNAKSLGATAIIGAGSYFAGGANGGELRVTNASHNVNGTTNYVKHILGAIEGNDGEDTNYNNNTNPLQMYSKNNLCNPSKLQTDARGIDSTTPINEELYNNGFSGTADNFLRFSMYDSNNFEWKNIFLGDANNSETPVADVKWIIAHGGINGNGKPYGDFQIQNIPGTQTGIYDKRKVMFFNHSDLNRDGRVDNQDYAILANNINRTGINVGSNPNAFDDYADINRDGTVDNKGLGLFSNEYLWNSQDPNTW